MRASAERNEALGVRNKAGTEGVASTQWKAKGQKKREKIRNKVMEEEQETLSQVWRGVRETWTFAFLDCCFINSETSGRERNPALRKSHTPELADGKTQMDIVQ